MSELSTLISDQDARNHAAWPSFVRAMENHDYGRESLNSAWAWFKIGWETEAPLILQKPDVAGVAMAPDLTEGSDGLWIVGNHLDEDFTIGEEYGSREDAIAGAVGEYGFAKGGSFATGRLAFERTKPPFPANAQRILEDVTEDLHHEFHEDILESWLDKATPHASELEADLAAVWKKWIEKHGLELEAYRVVDIEHHVAGDDVEETA